MGSSQNTLLSAFVTGLIFSAVITQGYSETETVYKTGQYGEIVERHPEWVYHNASGGDFPHVFDIITIPAPATSKPSPASRTIRATGPVDIHPEWTYHNTDGGDFPRVFDVYTLCEKQACIETGLEFTKNLNSSADPCEDFYEFACGNSNSAYEAPGSKAFWNQFESLNIKLSEEMRQGLLKGSNSEEAQAVKATKLLYRACMDVDSIEKRGIQPIETIVEEHGGWPMAIPEYQWSENLETWQDIHRAYARLIGHPIFYTLDVSIAKDHSTNRVISINHPTFTIPRPMLLNREKYSKEIAAYTQYLKNIVLLYANEAFHTSPSTQELDKNVQDVIDFEIKLAQITTSEKEQLLEGSTSQFMTITDLQKLFDGYRTKLNVENINWLETVREFFKPIVQIEETEKIVVYDRKYFKRLAGVLESTPSKTIVNYLQWQLIEELLPYTSQKLINLDLELKKEIYGIQDGEPRWFKCVTQDELLQPVTFTYIRNYFPENAITEALDIVKKVETKAKDVISEMDWMDEESKTIAREKVQSMTNFVGYSDYQKTHKDITRFYNGLDYGSSYFENTLRFRKYSLTKKLESLRQPVDEAELNVGPVSLEDYHYYTQNAMRFPAGVLQVPFFNTDLPDAVNYGSVGAVIGHKVFHGFDDTERQFDNNAIIKEWSSETKKAFKDRAKCFIDQFNRYSVNNLGASNVKSVGEKTLDENLADAAGLRAAFEAFRETLRKKHIHQLRLPGLQDYTDDQLFFLSFANTRCESATPKSSLYKPETDSHSTARLRIVGTLSNNDDFARAFGCPVGTSMNRGNKCSLED
ncbi:endothelin-converting enzyme homolog [Orussus abietinus]|uniref:endothelin-converting enzyme homolog n=1 Tax=Orussus abietinus TaxID=222816 RepID=UPI000626937F|nr:endothelin-converting enzyme homolog [Orussus abietinus]